MVKQIECPVCKVDTTSIFYTFISFKRALFKDGLSKIEFTCHGCRSTITIIGPVCIKCSGNGRVYEKTVTGNSVITTKCPECIGLEIIPYKIEIVDSGFRKQSAIHSRSGYDDYDDSGSTHRMSTFGDYYD